MTHSAICLPEVVAVCNSWSASEFKSTGRPGSKATYAAGIRAHHVRRLATAVVGVSGARAVASAINLANPAWPGGNNLLRAIL